jgi:formate-dependent nitrite reductase cytochrome c552 subunit
LYTCWLCTSFHWKENFIFCRDEKANERTLIEYNKENTERKIIIDWVTQVRNKKCSLCYIKRFLEIGINSFKIPWRTWKQDIIERVIELKQYISKKSDYNWKIVLDEYNDCKLNNCMYEL